MRRLPAVLGLVALGLLAAAPVAAQGASLERVEELARLGRAEEAREVLLEWWDSARENASRRDLQRGLWLRGRLTVDPVQAELDFQRLVVLYPRGAFTPSAILRLAQSAWEMGDEESARSHVATLVRDYADTPERDAAEAWLAEAGAAPLTPDTPAPAATNPAAVTPPSQAAATQPNAAGTYFVQLGAFVEEDRAMAVYEEARAQGFDVRVVRVQGTRFLHVRYGRFAQRADAVDELERLTEAGLSAALVRDERPETIVRN